MNEFTLTPNAALQVGGAMSVAQVDVTEDFEISFDVFLGSDNGGADGIAFVLHNSAAGSGAAGDPGLGLGAVGISNGVGIEFDTFYNVNAAGDIVNDHTNFFDTDAAATNSHLNAAVDLGDIEDGQWHNVRVSWNVSVQELSYWFDGDERGVLSSDIGNAYLGGSDFAYFGFTGSTGGRTNLQQVRLSSVDATFDADSVDGADFVI